MFRKFLVACLLYGGVVSSSLVAGESVRCVFGKDQWDSNNWFFVRRPDFKTSGQWVQGEDYIENDNPTHTSMLLKKIITQDVTITSAMSFQTRMAPSIAIVNSLMTNELGQIEFKEYWEVVLYDKGINVWRMQWKGSEIDGRKTRWTDHWQKLAFCEFPLEKETPYTLTVQKKGQNLKITVNNHTFGCLDMNLPDKFYVGITGEEGINRFYDFSVEPLQ